MSVKIIHLLNKIGFYSDAQLEERDRKAEKKGVNHICDELFLFQKRYDEEQASLTSQFDPSLINKVAINIWDEFSDEEETEVASAYAYVEHRHIPDSKCFDILHALMTYIVDNKVLPDTVSLNMAFYDSSAKYPILANSMSFALFKRWQINFTGITHKDLDFIINQFESVKSIAGLPISVISES
jgi:hypothetical protein